VNGTAFSRTTSAFENAKYASLERHEIDFPAAARVAKLSSQLFQRLDRTEPIQAEISLQLWVLRSTILFTLLPFDDPDLSLHALVDALEAASVRVPDVTELIQQLKADVTEIVKIKCNPKREWLVQRLVAEKKDADRRTGMLLALSAGKPPGWPPKGLDLLSSFGEPILPITSRRHLKSNTFHSVILPCACSNVPEALLCELLFSGIAEHIEVLLYTGEKFRIPKRLTVPADQLFSQHLQKSQVERELVTTPSPVPLPSLDAWINEAFWQGVHGASRNGARNLAPARYLLFGDGTGAFLPEERRVMTLPASRNVIDEDDLRMVRIQDICEGDTVVLRSGASGFLLDDISARIAGSEENSELLESATSWKGALEALLLTRTNEDVVAALSARGVSTRATSIGQWAGPDVLGPGSEKAFRELINVLAATKKIQLADTELASYTDRCWNSLKQLRGLHQKAGNQIRKDLFDALARRLSGSGIKNNVGLSDREVIRIDGDTGAQLLILRISSVDNVTAYVPPSRLGEIDDLKGNKWLG